MAKNFSLDFKGFLDLASEIDELGGDALKRATESALLSTDAYLTKEIKKAEAASPYNFNRTGKVKGSLDKDIKVEWDGTSAQVGVGYHVRAGGLPSIFLTYGTPTIKPDTNLLNATKGTGKHKKVIQQIQQEAFMKVLERLKNHD